MAIGYTPQTWVNYSSPALSAANLQTMDNGINSACDALDAMAVDGTGIPDATTAIKGRVALATTGVEAATKVPKATGADLAALLTAGGYTLTAPSGANSLDGIADTATWKKVAAAVATALNAGTYDAASVSAFGIGTTGAVKDADLNTITLGGLYRVVYNAAYNFPTGITSTLAQLLVLPGPDANNFVQILSDRDTYDGLWIRKKVGTFGSWYKIWNTGNDGNGGQPPEAKSNQTSDATIGWFNAVDCASGAGVTLPAGGTFEWFVATYGATYNSVKKGISAGGAMAGTASANLTMYYKRLTA